MTYLLLSAVFIATAVVAAVVLHRTSRPPAASGDRRRTRVRAVVLGGAVLLLLTAVFDSVMIAAGLFTYEERHLVGPKIGLAPVEDFAYPIAVLILLPALWTNLRSRRDP